MRIPWSPGTPGGRIPQGHAAELWILKIFQIFCSTPVGFSCLGNMISRPSLGLRGVGKVSGKMVRTPGPGQRFLGLAGPQPVLPLCLPTSPGKVPITLPSHKLPLHPSPQMSASAENWETDSCHIANPQSVLQCSVHIVAKLHTTASGKSK